MATATCTAVSIPSFTGLKGSSSSTTTTATNTTKIVSATTTTTKVSPRLMAKASLKDIGVAVVASGASVVLASNALAIDVLLGGDDGSLAFVPNNFSVSAGEKIVFKNNAGFPHNVVFDEDEIPSGVDASKISMAEEEYLNGPGETFVITLTEKGTYSFYCAPHQGAGMVGKVTVN